VICKICNNQVKNFRGLCVHIKCHDISVLDYYVRYEDFTIPKCVICGDNAKFVKTLSFSKLCCKKTCHSQLQKNAWTENGRTQMSIKMSKRMRENNSWKKNKETYPEKKLRHWLEQCFSEYQIVQEYIPEDFDRSFRIDFAFIKERIAIEVNGGHHYKDNSNDGEFTDYHMKREQYIISKGWQVINIPAQNIVNCFDDVTCQLQKIFNLKSTTSVINLQIKTQKQIRLENLLVREKEIRELFEKNISIQKMSEQLDISEKDIQLIIYKLKLKRDVKLVSKDPNRLPQLINERRKLLKGIDFSKLGWVAEVGKKFGVSSTQARRFITSRFPEIEKKAYKRNRIQ